MTLQEAIASGRPFRRAGEKIYQQVDDGYYLPTQDILATDWEIQPAEVTITREQFDRVLQAAVRAELQQNRHQPTHVDHYSYAQFDWIMNAVRSGLGLA